MLLLRHGMGSSSILLLLLVVLVLRGDPRLLLLLGPLNRTSLHSWGSLILLYRLHEVLMVLVAALLLSPPCFVPLLVLAAGGVSVMVDIVCLVRD